MKAQDVQDADQREADRLFQYMVAIAIITAAAHVLTLLNYHLV
jgi:hypothetical protein